MRMMIRKIELTRALFDEGTYYIHSIDTPCKVGRWDDEQLVISPIEIEVTKEDFYPSTRITEEHFNLTLDSFPLTIQRQLVPYLLLS